ncbi:MAG TPA: peptidylprolyl isomerase [Aquabacterium sp.]|nr:peptidylprolyl isomerase [Aquabacterium sp.]
MLRLRPLVHGLCLSLLLSSITPALAQLRAKEGPGISPRIPAVRNLSTELKIEGIQTTSDYIVAVINQEIITHTDVDKRVARIQETAPAGTRLPPPDELRRQVLDALIDEKVQISHAKALGLGISDAEVDSAIENIAAQNQLTLAGLRQRMQADGLDFDRYRNSLREQVLLQRLRDREVNARIQISDKEISDFLANDPSAQNEVALNLAHILIAVPEKASPKEIAALQAKAQDLQEQASRGVNFTQLVRDYSDDPSTKETGGGIGLRPVSRLPELFVRAVDGLQVGGVAAVVRSNAGFHVVKLVERENSAQATYTQQRSRHILLRANPKQSTQEQQARLAEIRKRIVGGQASFAQMARQYSEDGSAAHGGDLGWASPGQFVPEFERVLLTLQPGQISEPIVSRFGVHLIQLMERREVQLTDEQKREAARTVLRERRFEDAYEEWARELRAAAWVDLRDAP